MILMETITRATHDIDALDVSPEIVDLLEKYDINTRVGTFVNNFPYNYDERLVPVRLDGRRIDFYTASLEDIDIYTYVRRWRDCENSLSEGFSLSM